MCELCSSGNKSMKIFSFFATGLCSEQHVAYCLALPIRQPYVMGTMWSAADALSHHSISLNYPSTASWQKPVGWWHLLMTYTCLTVTLDSDWKNNNIFWQQAVHVFDYYPGPMTTKTTPTYWMMSYWFRTHNACKKTFVRRCNKIAKTLTTMQSHDEQIQYIKERTASDVNGHALINTRDR